MFEFIKNNLATIIISLVVFGLMAWVIVHKIVQKKKGTASSCGCGCSGCPEANRCNM